jgi:hypothetical protein
MEENMDYGNVVRKLALELLDQNFAPNTPGGSLLYSHYAPNRVANRIGIISMLDAGLDDTKLDMMVSLIIGNVAKERFNFELRSEDDVDSVISVIVYMKDQLAKYERRTA